jgi:hypothetical protein
VEAITSGLAPGIVADTLMAGLSVFGSDATGKSEKASIPASASPAVRREVATGRAIKGADRFIQNAYET